MSLFFKLPVVSGDASLPVIPSEDVRRLDNLEDQSYDHWVFTRGVDSLMGRVNGRQLTDQGGSASYTDNHVTLINTAGNALLTDIIDDTPAPIDTFCAVVRFVSDIEFQMIFGNIGDDNGGSAYTDNTGAKIVTNYRGSTQGVMELSSSAPEVGKWYFVASARDFSDTNNMRRTALLGGESPVESVFSVAGEYSNSDTPIGLGNPRYTNVNLPASTLDFAEFIAFDHALTASELTAVYQRSQTRMSELGIAI
ncbi:hypothetical protein FZZ93_01040 [Halomonas eurihalina]|uniref:LamG domain-containing protein n=1 Tax=Halomonas eurihalina TaxID=42566 RepID=A0A5D9DCJ9_HALER|nr:hypothetical protein [Halomonas eurihalina]MDR5858224.1 hypothetical protein [Halomonas eurihalina]TZG41279.1 hypothetical protein FZZ93_01040 [Halomonas eurihalina]